MKIAERIIDAIDIETVFAAQNDEEGRMLALALLKNMGFKDVDIVFAEAHGAGVRVRARAYLFRPGDNYGWLEGGDQ